MIRRTKNRKILYTVLVIDILLLLVIGLLFLQIKEKKADLIEETSARLLAIDSSAEEILANPWSRSFSQLEVLDNYFLSVDTTVDFLERLENTAKSTETTLKINQVEVKDSLRLNFSVQGRFTALSRFLVLLENFPYALRLERLDLRVIDKELWRGDFVINVMTQKI